MIDTLGMQEGRSGPTSAKTETGMGDPLIVSGGEAVSFGDVPFGPMRLSLRGRFSISKHRHNAIALGNDPPLGKTARRDSGASVPGQSNQQYLKRSIV
ncbi:hypothetical protein [Mesorhizobium caraganae]|uniref:hypothetical protein n=1 Tax=Mesorhizobium caraganae TaxID=483206 RepID=UPI0033357613